jgi:hypothetical protein
MIVTEIDHHLSLAQGTPGYVRSPGLHMSALYGSLYQQLEPSRFKKDSSPDATRMEVGLAFEETLEEAIGRRLLGERPGEFVTQHGHECRHYGAEVTIGDSVCYCGAGVAYSPDHLIWNGDGVFRVGEFKVTWMSIKQGIRDPRFAKWWTQIMAYCFHLGTRYARLYALFINGDYTWKDPYGGPHLRCWDVEFQQHELSDEWATLVRHGRKVGLLPGVQG